MKRLYRERVCGLRNSRCQNGQIVIGALIFLIILSLLVPAIIRYASNETAWTVKQKESTSAFEIAETAVEVGYTQLISSSPLYNNILNGGTLTGYNLDKSYADSHGKYAIQLKSGPGANQITIIGVAIDNSGKEVRAVKAVYSKQGGVIGSGWIAGNQTEIQNGARLEWGSLTAFGSIDLTGATYQNHPRMYSSSSITPFDTNPAPPNTDGVQWWTYKALPATPQIDLQWYINDAQSNANVAGCPPRYSTSNITFAGCTDTSGHTYYTTAEAYFDTGGSGNFIVGNLITGGRIEDNNGAGATNPQGSYDWPVPPQAWMEYGNDWAWYRCFDPAAPASYAAALASNYVASATYHLPNPAVGSQCLPGSAKVVFHGFIYSRTDRIRFENSAATFHGVVLNGVNNETRLDNNPVTIVYDPAVATNIHTVTPAVIVRVSWQDYNSCTWTNNPSCS